MFKKHHYLDGSLASTAESFVGLYEGRIIAFFAIIQFPRKFGAKRGHRLVVLPEYQGLGIGTKFIDEVVKMYVDGDWEVFATASHRGMVRYFMGSNNYKLVNKSLNKVTILYERDISDKRVYENSLKRYVYTFKTNKEIWGD